MIFSKIGKVLFLLIVLFAFVFSLNVLQLDIASRNTLLDARYFSRVFEENDVAGHFSEIMIDSMSQNAEKMLNSEGATADGANADGQELIPNTDGTPQDGEPPQDGATPQDGTTPQDAQTQMDFFRKSLEESIDKEWMDTELTRLVTGTFSYFIDDAKKLPEINIEPLKDAYMDVLIQEMISQSGADSIQQTELFIMTVEQGIQAYSSDGTVNDRVVNHAMNISWIREADVSKEAVQRIAVEIAEKDMEGQSTEDIRDYMISEIVKDKVNYYEIENSLDLNLLFVTMYGEEKNPVTETASLMDTIRFEISAVIITVLVLLFLILLITGFYPRTIFRWLGAGAVVSGVGMLAISLIAEWFNTTMDLSSTQILPQGISTDGMFLQNWIMSYSGGFYRWLLIQAIIVLVLGILLITASFFVPDKSKMIKSLSGTKAGAFLFEGRGRIEWVVLRILAVILIICVIVAGVVQSTHKIESSLSDYSVFVAASSKNQMDPGKALGIVLHIEKLFASEQEDKI